MKRKDIVKINNKEVVLNSQKEMNEFKKRYNNYNFMQREQINTWEAELRGPGPDLVPQITLNDVLNMVIQLTKVVNDLTLEMREGFRKINAEIKTINIRLDRIEEILERNNLR